MPDPIITSPDLSTVNTADAGIPNSPLPAANIPTLYQPNFDAGEQKETLASLLNSVKKPDKEYLDPVLTPQPLTKRYSTYTPFIDNEEVAANHQPWYDKWANGLIKMGAIITGTFAEHLMTIPDTVNAIQKGNLSSLYQSESENKVDTWLKNIEDTFPNYYSKWEQQHPFLSGLPFSGGAANFWSDKVLKNLGFTIAAIGGAVTQDLVVGALTEGIGEIPLLGAQIGKGALWLNKIFTGTNKVDELLTSAQQAGMVGEQLLNIEKLGQLAAARKVSDSIRFAANLYGAARTEGGFEARDGYNQVKQDLISDFTNKHGYEPTGADMAEIEKYATASANVRFGLNMAILTLSDAIQFDNILKPFSAGRKSLQSSLTAHLEEQGAKIGLADGSKDVFENIPVKSTSGKIWKLVKPQIPNILSEGVYEEGGQYAAQTGTEHYYREKYNGHIQNTIDGVINSTFYGLSQEFGSQDGLENIVLGALTGVLTGVGGHIRTRGERSQQTAAILNLLNSQSLTGLMENNYGNTAKSSQIQEDLQKAVKDNNLYEFKNLKNELFTNFILSGLQANRFDVRLEQLNMLKELSPEEFKKAFSIDKADDSSKTATEYVDMLIGKAKAIKKSYDAINRTYSNPFSRVKNPKTDEQIEENEKWKTFEEWKYSLLDHSANISDVNGRINSVGNKLSEIHPLLTTDMVKDLTKPEYYQELKEDFRKEIKDLEKQNQDELTSKEVRKFNRAKINQLKNISSGIEGFLSSSPENQEKNFLGVMQEVLQYQLNGDSKTEAIKNDQLPDIVNYGVDLNRLDNRKKLASKAYDILTTEEGFDTYFHNLYTKKSEGVSSETPVQEEKTAHEEENPDSFTIKDEKGKEVNFKIGDQYELKSAKPGYAKKLLIIGKTEEGKIKFEGENGTLKILNPRILEHYNKVLNDEEKIAEEQKKLQKVKDTLLQSQRSIQKTSGGIATGSDEDMREESKKATDFLFFSTTEASENEKNPQPHTIRKRVFLNNAKNFPNRRNLQVILLTQNQEDSLGLSGLTAKLLEGSGKDINPTDLEEGVVTAVYVEKTPEGTFFVDREGKQAGKLGEKADLDKIVFSTMPSTSLTWADNTPRFRKGEEEEAKKYQIQWREKRKQLFAMSAGQYEAYAFSISRGFPIFNPRKQGELQEHNPVTGTLVPADKLGTEGLIVISDNGVISHNGKNIPFAIGRPVLQYEDTLQFLNNRNLTSTEQETVYQLLKQLAIKAAKDGKLDPQIISYLQGILYWGIPINQDGIKKTGRNQIYIDDDFMLTMGNKDVQVPFTPLAIDKEEQTIRDFLATVFNNVNRYRLTKEFNNPFEEITGVGEDGKILSRTWKNYQYFLLSDKYELVEHDTSGDHGKTRPRGDLPLYTHVRELNPGVPQDYNFGGKYAILQGLELPKQEVKKKEEVEKPPETSNGEEKSKTNSFTEGTITTSAGENLSFTYKFSDKGNPIIGDINSNEEYEKYASRIKALKPEWSNEQILENAGRLIAREIIAAKNKEAKPKESKPEESKRGGLSDTKGPSLEESEYIRVAKMGVARMTARDYAEFVKWHAENVPHIPFEVLENLVHAYPDIIAWGVFENGIAKFYKDSKRGTEYHEIFEGIWKGFLAPEEKGALLAEFKNQKGSFKDQITGKNISYTEATDQQAKEKIADDFADFRLGKLPARTIGEKILKFFRNIIAFFKSFVSKPPLKEELFNKINTGAFRESVLPASIANEVAEYRRIEGLTEQETHEAVQDITARIAKRLFQDNKSLFNIEQITDHELFNTVKAAWAKEGKLAIVGEEGWKQLVTKTKDFIKSLGIEFDVSNNLSVNQEDNNKNDYSPQNFTVDIKKSASLPIKFLLSTATRTINVEQNNDLELPKEKLSSINGYQLVNFGRMFATLLDKLSNTTDIDKMVDKIVGIAQSDSDFVRIFTRLGGSRSNKSINFNELDTHDWRMLVNFFSLFSNQKPEALIQYIDQGNVYSAPANISGAIQQTKEEWISNIRSLAENPESIIQYDKSTKTYNVKGEKIKDFPIKIPIEMVDFLGKLGIPFSEEIYNGFNDQDKKRFAESVASIKHYIQKNENISSLKGDVLGINTPLNILSELYVKYTNPNQDSTYFNVEQKRVQSFIENNAVSLLENDFNGAKTLDELIDKLPHLQDVFSTNSQVLKKGGLFFNEQGERIRDFKVKYIQGTLDINRGQGNVTANLTIGKRFTQEINQNLNGNFYVLIPADSQTEWMLNLGHSVNYDELNHNIVWNKIYSIFHGYLADEVQLAQQHEERGKLLNVGKRANKLRFFADILNAKYNSDFDEIINNKSPIQQIRKYIAENSDGINKSIRDFIENTVKETKELLINSQEITPNNRGNYIYKGIDSSFISSRSVSLDKYNLTEIEVNKLLTFANLNYIISNIEMHKVLFGDPYQFAQKGNTLDETKRIKSYLSPRKTTFDHPQYNNFLNERYNQGLTEKDPGYHQFKSYTDTVTVDDIIVHGTIADQEYLPKSIREAYEKTNEADASSWIMDTTYREVKLKNGQWSDELGEPWFQYQMAYTRNKLAEKGEYKYGNKALEEKDNKLLEKGDPGGFVTEVLKPIVSGTKYGKTYIDQVLDKFSQVPLFYSFVEGSNLEQLYIKMWKEGIGYAVVKSGRKVGAEELHPIYNEDGSFNQEKFNNKIQVPWKAYGIQVENSYRGEKGQTRGSQLTKIATADLLEDGKPIDTNIENWNELSEEEKKGKSDVYKAVTRNREALDSLTDHGYESLLDKLGIEDKGDHFQVVDKYKSSDALRNEMLRRELSDNAKESITINPETGDFYIPFEASTHYSQIRDILYSMVDKAITSPKVNGAPLVQISATGFEELGIKRMLTKDGKSFLASDALKFYTKDKPYCEVLLPHWFKEKFKQAGFQSDKELLDYLNKHPEGAKILTGIGFRIPTQGLSSVEVFKVKGFLPKAMGNSIVVPSEITTKAGSDFDIDKINTYLKNIYLDHNKKIQLVEYQGSKEETLDYYGKIYDKIFEKKKASKAELFEAAQILAYDLPDPKNLLERYSNILDHLLADYDDISDFEDRLQKELEAMGDKPLQEKLKNAFVQEMYKKSLENEYFESLEELLTLPQNYERLLSPVSAGELKDIADELDKLTGNDESTIKARLLDRNYMTNQRNAFLTGKRWVGIGAVNITGHSITQRSQVYIDIGKASDEDKRWLGDGTIALPHNEMTVEGKKYPSLSAIKDSKGHHILDKLSNYITAFVDVAKDPFILKIIQSNNIVGTFMFMERVGIPTHMVALFMNQPIIRDYLNMIEREGQTFLFNRDKIADIKDLYPAKQTVTIRPSGFKENIKKKYVDQQKFTGEENAEQQAILREFLKYAKMAENLFELNQATNYDTASFRSGFDIQRKQFRTEEAKDNNIIQSVDNILNTSFIGTIAKRLADSRNALGELLTFEKDQIRSVIDAVIEPFSKNQQLKNDDFQRIGIKVINSFIDYLVQTQGKLNNRIKDMAIDLETSVANKVAKVKTLLPDNQLLRDIEVLLSDKENGPKNVRLRVNLKEAYAENLYTGYFRQLRDDSRTQKLYYDLVRLSLLQGTGNSRINFTNLIPIEDYSKVLSTIINKLDAVNDLHQFSDNYVFFRNNWKDNTIVPEVTPKFFADEKSFFIDDFTGDEHMNFMSSNFDISGAKSLGINSKERKLLLLHEIYNSRQVKYPVVKVRATITGDHGEKINMKTGQLMNPKDFAIMNKKGNFSYKDFYGYQQVTFTDGTPLTTFNRRGEIMYVYKQINLYGDSYRLQEYYNDGRPSVIDNGTVKTTELSNEQIIAAYNGVNNSSKTDKLFNEAKSKGDIQTKCD